MDKNIIVLPEEIKKEIRNLLYTKFYLPEDFVFGDRDYTFFGLHGLLVPRELTYLTHMLEARYDIQFGMEEYDDPMFYSLVGLSEIIVRMVKDKVS